VLDGLVERNSALIDIDHRVIRAVRIGKPWLT
jgi:hypothetical protein